MGTAVCLVSSYCFRVIFISCACENNKVIYRRCKRMIYRRGPHVYLYQSVGRSILPPFTVAAVLRDRAAGLLKFMEMFFWPLRVPRGVTVYKKLAGGSGAGDERG